LNIANEESGKSL